MHSLDFLRELLAVLGASLAVVFLGQRIGVPSVVGFLVAGAALGPGGLRVIRDRATIEGLADIGVILLLFTVGLELSLRELWRMRRIVLLGGLAQLSLTALAGLGVGLALGMRPGPSLFFGFLVALSSTALVLTVLSQRGETGAPHGRVALSILIFQDLAVVPLMLVTPWLAGTGGGGRPAVSDLAFSALATAALLAVIASLLPRALDVVARTRSREIFTISVVVAALGTAYLTAESGLSLALGAFLAGLAISGSRYGSEVLGEVLPFKHVFNSLFFVSVGVLAGDAGLPARPDIFAAVVVAVLLVKGIIAGGVTLALGFGPRISTLVGFGLCQVGEFSFVLAHVGLEENVIDTEGFQLLLTVTLVSLALTPFLMGAAPHVAERFGRIAWLARWYDRHDIGRMGAVEPARDHVVVCGYGLNGRSVTRVLRRLRVPYVVIELNPALSAKAETEGVPVVYGDATRRTALEHVHVETARAVVVTVEDRVAARRIVETARALNPHAYVLVRTRYVADASELQALGATEVVPEELESSLELSARVMAAYGASPSAIFVERSLVRRDGYRLLFDQEVPTEMPTLRELLTSADLATVEVQQGSQASGRTLMELDLRRRAHVSVLSVERGGTSMVNPAPDLALEPGDRVVVFGRADAVRSAEARFLRRRPAH